MHLSAAIFGASHRQRSTPIAAPDPDDRGDLRADARRALAPVDHAVIRVDHMATKRRFTRVVPIRVTTKHRVALRRFARQRNVDVSQVVRDAIDDYLARNSVAENSEQDASGQANDPGMSAGRLDLDLVGAAA